MPTKLSPKQAAVLAGTLLAVFILVYVPHFTYHFPYHVDEWHHISQGLRLGNYGEYFEVLRSEGFKRFNGMEMGFQAILFLLSFVVNLILVYQYLPALWAVLSAAALFYVVWERSKHNFFISWLAVVFLASIKSNVNLTGFWFFTPLTFSIPLVYLYLHFYAKGLEVKNIKYIFWSLGIMIFLVPTHSLSVLFSLPLLLIISLINFRFIFKEFKYFLSFLVIPIGGVLFYKYMLNVPWPQLVGHLANSLQFDHGWGVLEVKNSFVEVYSWLGYLLAVVGVVFIYLNKRSRELALFLVWPLTVLALILFYRAWGVSILSPYQRNMYYFVLALPYLSAIGLGYAIDFVTNEIKHYHRFNFSDQVIKTIVATVLVLFSTLIIFSNYYLLPTRLNLYQVMSEADYRALKFLAQQPPGKVLALPMVSTAIYAVARDNPVGDLVFYGDRTIVERFFLNNTCQSKLDIIKTEQVKYILSPFNLNCGFNLIYQEDGNYIYRINNG
ncbi:MAG: hypothetical protein PHW95_01745 [Patescibacteria group bacterium]|nr:hypothetical protein [Patescibacteria group bacterium]